MGLITVVESSGVVAFVNAASGGDEYANDGVTVPLFLNDGAAAITVTYAAQRPAIHPDAPTVHHTQSIPAGEMVFGPTLHPEWWNTALARVQVTYSGVVGLQVAAIRVPPAPAVR